MGLGMFLVISSPEPMCGKAAVPKTANLIDKEIEILKTFIPKCVRDRYQGGIVDTVVCEVLPTLRKHCRRYYNEKGPSMKGAYSKETLELIDDVLYLSLQSLLQLHTSTTWKVFIETIRETTKHIDIQRR